MKRPITVDIHGSCVSRDVFREQDMFEVGTYIGRCSIMSTQYPKIFDSFSDESDQNSNWEKRMLNVDFTKSIFEEFRNSKSDYLIIDLIDECFELLKIENEGRESAVTYSQVLRRSSYKRILNITEDEVINTRRFDTPSIIKAIENYAREILTIYTPEQIIINEAYPVNKYWDNDKKLTMFDEERSINVKRNRYKLKLYYSVLENELSGCHIIKMSSDIFADELHQWGLATTHFEKRFYQEVLEQVIQIAGEEDKKMQRIELEVHEQEADAIRRIRDVDLSFQAKRLLESENIVILGAQQYYSEFIEKLDKRVKAAYLFPYGEYRKELENEYCILDSVEAIEKLENPFVLIARGKAEDIERISDRLRRRNISYDHLSLYVNDRINVRILKALKYYDYTDIDGNRILIDKEIDDNVFITRRDALNGYVEVGVNKVKSKLSIYISGENNYCRIGKGGLFVDASISLVTNGIVEIGDECMLSRNIELNQSDQHHIFDQKTGKRINYAKAIIIGNHVWVGHEVELLGQRLSQ